MTVDTTPPAAIARPRSCATLAPKWAAPPPRQAISPANANGAPSHSGRRREASIAAPNNVAPIPKANVLFTPPGEGHAVEAFEDTLRAVAYRRATVISLSYLNCADPRASLHDIEFFPARMHVIVAPSALEKTRQGSHAAALMQAQKRNLRPCAEGRIASPARRVMDGGARLVTSCPQLRSLYLKHEPQLSERPVGHWRHGGREVDHCAGAR